MRGFCKQAAIRCAAVTILASFSTSAFDPKFYRRSNAFSYTARTIVSAITNLIIPKIIHADSCDKNTKIDQLQYINSETAKMIDDELMSTGGFSLDQLMELAGLSVASSCHDYLTTQGLTSNKKILVICGHGNNGGDGLVAARHLQHFGYEPYLYIPRHSEKFQNLEKQCLHLGIITVPTLLEDNSYSIIIDALFGFSFKGPVREEYKPIIQYMATTNIPVLSVDIPSGWDVELGDIYETAFTPEIVVSLTAPKLCMNKYSGAHYLGGR